VAVDDYLMVHRSEGHSTKTLEWHTTALGFLLRYLTEAVGIEDPHELETAHLRRWVVWLGTPESVALRPGRTAPSPRSKRTIHTYARSAHAFGKWLHEEGLTDIDVTHHFTLPKLSKPLIRILEEDEFARLLAACEVSQYPRAYILRDRALLWVLYDTGIRLAELTGLTLGSLDLRTGVLTVRGKGDKERRVAPGGQCTGCATALSGSGSPRPRLDGCLGLRRSCRSAVPGGGGAALTPGHRADYRSPQAALRLGRSTDLAAHLPAYLRGALPDAGG
jgi:site-specific recombinase XerD